MAPIWKIHPMFDGALNRCGGCAFSLASPALVKRRRFGLGRAQSSRLRMAEHHNFTKLIRNPALRRGAQAWPEVLKQRLLIECHLCLKGIVLYNSSERQPIIFEPSDATTGASGAFSRAEIDLLNGSRICI